MKLAIITSMKLLNTTNNINQIQLDDEDYERISKYRWYVSNPSIYRSERGHNKAISNEVMQNWSAMYDHIDRNPFNNQKANLRTCTFQQNCCNRSKANLNALTSKHKGVCYRKDNKNWRAYIDYKTKRIYIGTFQTELEAANAYNTKAKELHGEFAVLNVL